ncbi:MAG: hypothetical protein SAL07_08150 [Oscillatoria sp. PMC 1051.18]|nr:hypothetical protein [Oscillatoria sp. PMC 1050.18]MEC5029869.1 hypothetical protein [Oscillatoria sp. PMC 1051.18]
MNAFVGKCDNLTEAELKNLLLQFATESSYYCFRWAHKISKFETELPDKLSPEGQMFDSVRELRWQWKKDCFNVLVLSSKNEETGFQLIGKKWEYQQLPGRVYPPTETRLPKVVDVGNVNIAQRYFLDTETKTVHFVALTIA